LGLLLPGQRNGGIDNLLSAQEAKPPKKKKPKTRMQQILRMRSGDEDYDDETSISSVANDVLETRQQEAAIASLKKEIDRKWGQGTWDSIVDEREKRVAAKAEKQKKAKAAAAAKADENKEFWDTVYHWMLEGFKLIGVLTAAVYSCETETNKNAKSCGKNTRADAQARIQRCANG
jgi:hypothetical protein